MLLLLDLRQARLRRHEKELQSSSVRVRYWGQSPFSMGTVAMSLLDFSELDHKSDDREKPELIYFIHCTVILVIVPPQVFSVIYILNFYVP